MRTWRWPGVKSSSSEPIRDPRGRWSPVTTPADGTASAEGRLLLDVLRVVDDLGIRWCILHGYKTYPADVPSDVDILLEGDIRSNFQQLSRALPKNGLRILNALQHESSACYAVIGREDAAG